MTYFEMLLNNASELLAMKDAEKWTVAELAFSEAAVAFDQQHESILEQNRREFERFAEPIERIDKR